MGPLGVAAERGMVARRLHRWPVWTVPLGASCALSVDGSSGFAMLLAAVVCRQGPTESPEGPCTP